MENRLSSRSEPDPSQTFDPALTLTSNSENVPLEKPTVRSDVAR